MHYQSHIRGPLYTPPAALLNPRQRSPAWIEAHPCHSAVNFSSFGAPESSLSGLVLLYPIPHSIPPFPYSSAWDGSYSIPTGAPIMHPPLLTHPFLALLHWDSTTQSQSVNLCLDWCSCISFRTSYPPVRRSSAWI